MLKPNQATITTSNSNAKAKFKTIANIGLLASAILATSCFAKPLDFIISSDGEGQKSGVYQLSFDTESPLDYQLNQLIQTQDPSYLSIQNNGNTIFAVNEETRSGASVFEKNMQDKFVQISQLSNLGNGPCYISYNPINHLVAVAFYSSPNVSLLRFDPITQTLSLVKKFEHQGKGEHKRQEKPHPHYANWSPEGRFLYGVDLGIDEIKQYQQVDGQWQAKTALKLEKADGPRHLVFHPTKNTVYLINELSNTLVVMKQDLTTGDLSVIQRTNTLQADFTEHSQAAAVRISNDGRFVYVSNRGENTIAVFKVNRSGKVDMIQSISSGGNWPRDFNFSADQDAILVANTRDNQVSLLERNTHTGELTSTDIQFSVATPKFIQAK